MKKVIGLAGYATVGKDTFYKYLAEVFEENGLKLHRVALADALKAEMDDYLLAKYKISAFETKPELKSIIRPELVSYAKKYRIESKGTFWTQKVQNQLDKIISKGEYVCITDIRYNEYENDEYPWLVYKNDGALVYIEKYKKTEDGSCIFTQAPNEDEFKNCKSIKNLADYWVSWPEHQDLHDCKVYAIEFFKYLTR